MADIGINQQWLVSPNAEIEAMWLDVQIQEKKSRMSRHRQDIEDLEKGQILSLRAKIMMLDKEIQFLENKRKNIELIDVE